MSDNQSPGRSRTVKTRYFKMIAYCGPYSGQTRVVVFPRGRSPGSAYWPALGLCFPLWTLRLMKEYRATEISRAAARKIAKHCP